MGNGYFFLRFGLAALMLSCVAGCLIFPAIYLAFLGVFIAATLTAFMIG
jgi:hypothetical protein